MPPMKKCMFAVSVLVTISGIAYADVRVKDDKAAWTTRDPIDQFATIAHDSQNDVDVWYVADVYGSKLSESGGSRSCSNA